MMSWHELTQGRKFITDLGEEVEAEVGGERVTLGRFAVWEPLPKTDRHQVIEVGHDAQELAARHDIPDEMIMVVADPMEMLNG